MKCSEFAKVVMDVARSETVPMDTVVRAQALAHTQHCSHCAACLASEQSLSQGLRVVTTVDESLTVPVGLEANLLAAFRVQHAVVEAAPVISPVLHDGFEPSPFKVFFWRMRWAFAAAAIGLLIFAVARGMQPRSVGEPNVAKHPAAPTPSVTTSQPPAPRDLSPAPEAVAPPENLSARADKPERQPRQIKAQWPKAERRGRVTVDMGEFVVDEPEAISANDFLVFDYARNLPPADSTQLLRVRMPSERLAPLGIQVPRTVRNSGYVNADLLVGSDGVPRAIRVADR
ncbi:MAG: hypothetical protein U0Y68_24610 [Blastocatellia bacterium]